MSSGAHGRQQHYYNTENVIIKGNSIVLLLIDKFD